MGGLYAIWLGVDHHGLRAVRNRIQAESSDEQHQNPRRARRRSVDTKTRVINCVIKKRRALTHQEQLIRFIHQRLNSVRPLEVIWYGNPEVGKNQSQASIVRVLYQTEIIPPKIF